MRSSPMTAQSGRRASLSINEAVAALLDSPVRREIVDILANLPTVRDEAGLLPGLTAAELAEALGLHVTTVRFHLDQLVAGQLLDSEFRAGRVGRPRKVYRFRPGSMGEASSAEAYQALAELLAESWEGDGHGMPLTPEQAGARWAASHTDAHTGDDTPARSVGGWLGKVGRTVDMLHRWGYTPDLSTSNHGHTVDLTLVDCPFMALAQSKPEIVCGVHRGLLRGAMDAVGEVETEVTLRPFVSPGRCAATLTTHAEFGVPTEQPATSDPSVPNDEETSRD